MRKTARVILVKDHKLLVMRRDKFGESFYALIGGGIEPGESAKAAALRELREEASIEANNPRLVIVLSVEPTFGRQYVFLCDYLSGEPALSPDSEEAKQHALGDNRYYPTWLPITDLERIDFRPNQLRHTILKCLEQGWATQPIRLTIDN